MGIRLMVVTAATALLGALAGCGLASLQDGGYRCGLIRDTSENHMTATNPAIEALVAGGEVSTIALGGEEVPFEGAMIDGSSRFKSRIDLNAASGTFSDATEYDPAGTGTFWVMCVKS